jgi:alanine-alpha-ketoisovalerate/valine-pyruvate aminotransferase
MTQINIALDTSHLTPAKAYALAKKYGQPITELEDVIASKRDTAYKYALNILKGRFIKGEAKILTDVNLAYWYTENVVKDRWLEAEDIIMKSPQEAVWYARHFIKGRWLEAEQYIKLSAMEASMYARHILKERWLEAEDVIRNGGSTIWWPTYCEHFGIN